MSLMVSVSDIQHATCIGLVLLLQICLCSVYMYFLLFSGIPEG